MSGISEPSFDWVVIELTTLLFAYVLKGDGFMEEFSFLCADFLRDLGGDSPLDSAGSCGSPADIDRIEGMVSEVIDLSIGLERVKVQGG